jgi:hypothetical protein
MTLVPIAGAVLTLDVDDMIFPSSDPDLFVIPAKAGIQRLYLTGFRLGRKLETSLRSFSPE